MSTAAIFGHWPSIATLLATLFGAGGGGVLIKAWLDHKAKMRTATDEVAMTLVTKLSDKIDRLEVDQKQERLLCEARLQVQRHKFNNLDMAFDGVLTVLRVAPDRASELIEEMVQKRQAQRSAEAAEAAAVMHAAITAAGPQPALDEAA